MQQYKLVINSVAYGSEEAAKAILKTTLDLFARDKTIDSEITHVEVELRGVISIVFKGAIVRIHLVFSKTTEFLWEFNIMSGNQAVCRDALHYFGDNFSKHLKSSDESTFEQLKLQLSQKKFIYSIV